MDFYAWQDILSLTLILCLPDDEENVMPDTVLSE